MTPSTGIILQLIKAIADPTKVYNDRQPINNGIISLYPSGL
jgi:hypothetical protein